jgi:hypothetical protein
MILTVTEREQYLDELPDAQRSYLTNQLARGKRTAFANAMAEAKGHYVPDDAEPEMIEMLLDDWIYSGYTDAGAVSPDLRCECGRPLRYQHRVTHKKSGEVRHFGIDHLKEHLGIDAAVVSAIKKGFDAIDYELDELLIKLRSRWQPDTDWSASEHLTADMRAQLDLGLPLLDRQIRRLLDRKRRAQAQAHVRPKAAPPEALLGAPPSIDVTAETKPQQEEPPVDLFDWAERMSEHAAPSAPAAPAPSAPSAVFGTSSRVDAGSDRLPARLRDAVLGYCEADVRSARVICELLIRDYGASDTRFSTGKPHLYIAVCRAIEAAYPHAKIEAREHEDRYYSLG